MSDDNQTIPPQADNHVPYQRFSKVVEQRAALEARVAELEAEAQRLQERAATADTLSQQVQHWQTQAQQFQTNLGNYQAAARVGVTDPELYEAAQWAHSRLPEQDRPSFADALQAWKSDPSAAPLVLRPHLQPAPAPAAPQAAQPSAQPAPNPNNGAQAFAEAPKALDVVDMTLDQYRQHRDRFKGTSLI
jgi:hypothetical protein